MNKNLPKSGWHYCDICGIKREFGPAGCYACSDRLNKISFKIKREKEEKHENQEINS